MSAGLAAQDMSALNVLGFGEISLAVGWPADAPSVVCKRTPPFSAEQFANYRDSVESYVKSLRAAGLSVVDTEAVHLERNGRTIAYLLQPMLPAPTLGQNVLSTADPDPEHPFLVAVAKSLEVVTPTLSLDAQITNFSWNGSEATLIDVGTPFMWSESGEPSFEMDPFLRMLPALARPFVKRDMIKLMSRWQEPRPVAVDVVSNLYREGLTDWVDPAIIALNRQLGHRDPIVAAEAKAFYEEDLKTFPKLKRLQALERWWQSTVRRRSYDFFIFTTIGDKYR